MDKDIQEVTQIMDAVINDSAVPRNIKASITQAKEKITKMNNPEVDLTSAIYLLDEVLNDINMPFHTRTDLMGAISELERMKENIK